jgi:hypothetical protein
MKRSSQGPGSGRSKSGSNGLSVRKPKVWSEFNRLVTDKGVLTRVEHMNVPKAIKLLDSIKEGIRYGWFASQSALNADASNKVRSILGQTQDYRGAILGKLPRAKVKRDILQIVKSKQVGDNAVAEVLQRAEIDQAKKFGPKSTYEGWYENGAMDKLLAINTDKPLSSDIDDKALELSWSTFEAFLAAGSIKSLTFDEVMSGGLGTGPVTIESMGLDTSKSSGYPHMAKSYKPNDNMSNEDRESSAAAYQWIKTRFETLKPRLIRDDYVPRFRCAIYFRITSVGEDWMGNEKKARVIIAVSKDEVVLGKVLTAPIQSSLKHVTYQGGPDEMD